MGKLVIAVVAATVALIVGLVSVVSAAAGSGTTDGPSSAPSSSGGPSSAAAVPAAWVALYGQAAATCPGLDWSVLAAIGTVESASGQSRAPGVHAGTNAAGAEGPMQFEPSTFATYATVGPDGVRPASPYDPVDAVYTAAALLCADGAASPSTLRPSGPRLQPFGCLCRHRADPGPRSRAGSVGVGGGGHRPVLRRR